jgi:WxcM-like, C-terminal
VLTGSARPGAAIRELRSGEGMIAEILEMGHPDDGRSSVTLNYVQASYAVGEDVTLFPSNDGVGPSAQLLRLPVVPDDRGKLSFIEGGRHVPFDIARVYYLYDVPAAAVRGGHAHKNLKQLIIALSGSFDVRLDTGRFRRVVQLNRPNIGLLISSMVWREIDNFSSGGICLVLASMPYEEADYYRDYETFLRSC